jgi:hypothetical protein
MESETEISNVDELNAFLSSAKPGERRIYYRGFLWVDRYRKSQVLSEVDRLRLDELANAVLVAAESGLLRLFQRRQADDVWEYIAIRTAGKVRVPKPKRPVMTDDEDTWARVAA